MTRISIIHSIITGTLLALYLITFLTPCNDNASTNPATDSATDSLVYQRSQSRQ